MGTRCCVICVCLAVCPATRLAAQARSAASLAVTVVDPSGALVPQASMTVISRNGSPVATPRTYTSLSGRIVADDLQPGRYTVRVDATGFASELLDDVRIGSGPVRRTVRLELPVLSESLTVDPDPQGAVLDPRGFSTFLSREQIDALPDDPRDLAQALLDLAPPGAVIRIDGFTGGVMPPKSQILSIRLPRIDAYAAEDHGGLAGLSFIDIVTTPGGGRIQGTTEIAVRHGVLNARNPLAPRRSPESLQLAGIALDGPLLPARVSFAVSVRAGWQRQTATIHAALPGGGLLSEPVTRPQQWLTASGRVAARLGATQTLRVSWSSDRRLSRNLGAGDFNLRERAYRSSTSDATIRVAAGGPVGRRMFMETRMQLGWSGTRLVPDLHAPTVRVLDAFSSGGAQVAGGGRTFGLRVASDLDYARRAHAWRFGVLVERDAYYSNRRTNDLGTYTFASLDDFQAGRPASYTRRIGDPEVRYRNAQLGVYAQDDYRASRSVLLSYGIRYERQTLVAGAGRLLPRAGIIWSPFRSGSTAVRVGSGVFSDWLAADVYERSLLLDGTRQHEIHVRFPSYPEPASGEQAAPRERTLLAGDLRLPAAAAMSIGVERQFAHGVRISATYGLRRGWYLLRGHNLNAPVGGRRPDPTSGNVIEARNEAALRARTLTVHLATTTAPARTQLSATYLLSDGRTNSAGAFSPPADASGLAAEWGPTGPAHLLVGTVTARVIEPLTIALTPRWRSGLPYTITTGRDDNGDGLFTDRPAETPRNSARTPPHWEVGARVSFVVQFGRSDMTGPRLPSAGADAESARAGSVSAGTSGARYRVEIFASARNVTNRPSYAALGSVMGSPFFGRPTVALDPRRIDIGARVGF